MTKKHSVINPNTERKEEKTLKIAKHMATLISTNILRYVWNVSRWKYFTEKSFGFIGFDYAIKYKKDKNHTSADAVSWNKMHTKDKKFPTSLNIRKNSTKIIRD